MLQFLLGLVIMVAGGAITIKSEQMLNMFGSIGFFERVFGTEGGSRLGYKLVGVFTFFIGLLIMTGMIEGFVYWLLGPLIRVSAPQ